MTANNFGSDDIVYIDNQDKVPNDLSMARFVNSGSSQRSTIQFAPRSTELGGYLEVVLADAKPGFSNLADWMQKLGLSVPPMVSG